MVSRITGCNLNRRSTDAIKKGAAAAGGALKKGGTYGKSFGDSAGYESTVQMNFRGQDKKRPD